MKIWQISREYANLAEAGGVKNVVCSLCEGLHKMGHDVTLFIPLYGCSDLSLVHNYQILKDSEITISVGNKEFLVCFATGFINNIKILFVVSSCFTEKLGVYTYTLEEEIQNPNFIRGQGHIDAVENEIMFQKSIVEYAKKYNDFPNIVHCHDATTALIPVLAKNFEKSFSTVNFIVTIHNAGPAYHHEISDINKAIFLTGLAKQVLSKGLVGKVVEPYLLASYFAKLSTVSPWYAEEITDPKNKNTQGLSKAFFKKNVKIFGICNGIDFEKYNPALGKKNLLPYSYYPEKMDLEGKYRARKDFVQFFSIEHKDLLEIKNKGDDCLVQYGFLEETNTETVLFSYHGRLVHQKGLNVLENAIPLCIEKNDNLRFVIIGQGDVILEKKQIELAKKYPGKVLYLRGYHKALARLSVAISDYIVLPSFFEPCGLEDFISSIVGTIPVAHKTGGLQKIINNKTGFLYSQNTEDVLSTKLLELVDFKNNHNLEFLKMIKAASEKVHYTYDWSKVIKEHYIPLYNNE